MLYPRASGYVRRWHVDIGDKVKEGQLLAEIDTPELDQQLAQARAQLAQAAGGASSRPRRTATSRARTSSATRRSSPRALALAAGPRPAPGAGRGRRGERRRVAEANVAAQQANIRRLDAAQGVRARDGALRRARSPQRIGRDAARWSPRATRQPLFKLAATDPARVFVQVPQDVAPERARRTCRRKVTVREYPGRVFEGKVARAAGELDPATRTMNTEVRVPNGDGALIAGMYAEVVAHAADAAPRARAARDGADERRRTACACAVVDARRRRCTSSPVVVERDTGATIEHRERPRARPSAW